jgi:glycerol-3-phosphate O-acyltransferase
MNLLAPFNFIAKKLLFLWIKTESIHDADIKGDDDTDDSSSNNNHTVTIYVVESRAWTDLLVLEHECEIIHATRPLSRIKQKQLSKWHHIYTVAQAQPLKAWLQQESKRSRMLKGLAQVLIDNPELDINFIPVVIFWGRPVQKQKHWFLILFSETWGFAGRIRRFFTILFNGKNTLIQFSPAISFKELIDDASTKNDTDSGRDSNRDAIDYTQQQLSQRLTEIRTATLGPDISHRRTLVRELLANEAVKSAIDARHENNNISRYKATKTAENYLNEIVADRSYITIQILQRVLTAFWNKFYSGITVHFSEHLKTLALTHELVYVPCHRSHIDYLLLSYVIHNEGLAIPYIAAGKNLNMPVIGPVLRKAGAFFIRRSFKGNHLYSTVMFEYLASQISTGMPVEYFIEGGRSRTGRLLQPKPGMLAMTIRSFLKYKKRPVAFIPVYIGYEKMIEGRAYLAELSGDDKKSETLFSSIRSFLNIRGFYGRVTTNFGQAILLDDILDQHCPEWENEAYDDEQRPNWIKPCVQQVSHLVMQRINECCAVNSVNLIATALLAAPNQTMDEGELKRTLSFYLKLIKGQVYSMRITLTTLDAEEQIKHAEALGMVKRRKHEMGDFIYLGNAHAVRLTYYRNNTLHLLVLPSLIASCFINARELERDKIMHFIKITYPFLKNEFFLPWAQSDIETIIDSTLQQLTTAGLLKHHTDTGIFTRSENSTDQLAQLTALAQILSPLLELYYMIFALLAEHGPNTLTRERLEELCYLMAQRYSLMYEINSPDFFDKKLIANFINSLIGLSYIETDSKDNLGLSDIAYREGIHARRLLDKTMQYNILQMLRTTTSRNQIDR